MAGDLPDPAKLVIRGVVREGNQAVITLRVRGGEHPEQDLDVTVDSGYTGTITLPAATCSALGLVRQSNGRARIADGSERHFDIYTAEILWDGAWRRVLISTVGPYALIGMKLLAGHELRVEVVPGGAVEIARLP